MIIQITQKDIDNGKRGMCYDCPIALASQRSFKTKGIRVHRNEIVIKGKAHKLPEVVQTFIYNFDRNMEVQPFSFEIY